MKFTNGEAYQLYIGYTSQLSKSTSKEKRTDTAAAKFIQVHVPYGNHKSLKIKFSRLLESKPDNKSTREVVQKWEETLFLDIDTTIVQAEAENADNGVNPKDDGEIPKPRSQIKTMKQRSSARAVVSAVERLAAEQNLTKEEALQLSIDECRRIWKRKHVCDVCDKQCSSSSLLKSHSRVHSGEKPYICTWLPCTFTTSSKPSLQRHVRNKHTHEKPYKCCWCEKSFTSNDKLKRHSRIHNGEKPFVCEHCGRTFSRRFNLATHVRLHTGDKPYCCDRCGKTFAQLAGRNQHIQHCTGVAASFAEVHGMDEHIQEKMDHVQLCTSAASTLSQFPGPNQHKQNSTGSTAATTNGELAKQKENIQYSTGIAAPTLSDTEYVLPTPVVVPVPLPSISGLTYVHGQSGMF